VTAICVIIALGDSAGNPSYFQKVASSILEAEDSSDTFIHLGDLFDDVHDSEQLTITDSLLSFFNSSLVVRGNHDTKDFFYSEFPQLPISIDICSNAVTLIGVDSNENLLYQTSFIRNIIEQNQERRFIIALHHHLIGCTDSDPSNTFWKVILENILRPQDLVLTGHTHAFCESRLNNGALIISTAQANRKRYSCLESANCDNNHSLEYLRISLENESSDWNVERIRVY
jgi:predicted phosphodiesterase